MAAVIMATATRNIMVVVTTTFPSSLPLSPALLIQPVIRLSDTGCITAASSLYRKVMTPTLIRGPAQSTSSTSTAASPIPFLMIIPEPTIISVTALTEAPRPGSIPAVLAIRLLLNVSITGVSRFCTTLIPTTTVNSSFITQTIPDFKSSVIRERKSSSVR